MANLYFATYLQKMSHLSVVVPEDVFWIHGLASGMNHTGEVNGAPGLDEKLLSSQDGSARFWNEMNVNKDPEKSIFSELDVPDI